MAEEIIKETTAAEDKAVIAAKDAAVAQKQQGKDAGQKK